MVARGVVDYGIVSVRHVITLRFLVHQGRRVKTFRSVVGPAPWVAEVELTVRKEGVQVIASGHCSEPLRFYRHESLSHWVYCQQGVLQRDHSQQTGLVFLCEYHLCCEDLVLQPDHCPACVHWDRASVGQPGPG